MLKAFIRSLLKTTCRLFPQERGKFRILNEIYFGLFAPEHDYWVTEKLRGSLIMRLNISEFLQAHLFLFGSYELPTVKFIENVLQPNSVCMDVGAQIGYLSLVMATSVKRTTRVISFEPEDRNIRRFKENMALNFVQNVELLSSAVSNKSGTLKLYLSIDNNAGTHSTIADDPNVGAAYEEVPCVTLDEVVEQLGIGTLDLIKVDVEGAELEVIEGATSILTTLHPTLIVELSEKIQSSRGFSTVAFKEKMYGFGYLPHTIADDGTLVSVQTGIPHVMDNVVFVHESRLGRLRPEVMRHRA